MAEYAVSREYFRCEPVIISHQLIFSSHFQHYVVRQLIPEPAYDVLQDRKAKGRYHSAADTFPALFDN